MDAEGSLASRLEVGVGELGEFGSLSSSGIRWKKRLERGVGSSRIDGLWGVTGSSDSGSFPFPLPDPEA